MTIQRPPTIDKIAAQRWLQIVPPPDKNTSPWLHEEVARRMEERLSCMVQQPKSWLHWQPLQGGLQVHSKLLDRYHHSACYVTEQTEAQNKLAQKLLTPAWWKARRWQSRLPQFKGPDEPIQMLWANMALHMAADPFALLQRWHGLLAVDGFVMFSCLGPDTLIELRKVYAQMGWEEPAHQFTDMHDWGDMLVQAGFAEPVMDMERIRLTYSSPESLIAELRQLGRNLHVQRHGALRGRTWKKDLYHAISQNMQENANDGRLSLTFEIIYGHAFKPVPRIKMQSQATFTLEQMQTALRQTNSDAKNRQ